ncbi:MAG TPA: hypothetical protein VF203_06820 [Burkholderiales bacterium]
MVNVKGTAIAGRRQYVLRYHGEEKLKAVLAQLKDQEAAKRLENGALKSAWYPFSLFIDLSETIDRVVGRGDGKLYRAMAAQTAEDDLSTVYKVFFKFLQPMYIVQKAAQLWSSYYTSGKMLAKQLSPGTIEFEIAEFETPHWAHCESVIGWAERSIQLTGVKGVHADHLECRAKGAAHCRFRISWKA